MKRGFKLFGVMTVLGSLVAGGYYLVFMRSRRPQVELYFDDGSMVALPGDAEEAAPFMAVAAQVLETNPISG